MGKLVVIPVSEGETHTVIIHPIGDYVEGQCGITVPQLQSLGIANDVDISEVPDMTCEERYMWLVEDVGYYTFTSLAVVDEDKLPLLEEIDAKFDWPDSSGPYEMFNQVIIAMAEKTIDIYGDDLQIDPDY